MSYAGYEWVVIGIIVVALFIWGPSKIPEIARSLGRARKEFDEAAKGLTNPSVVSAPRIESTPSDPLIETAQRLGVSTEGKTRQEIHEAMRDADRAEQRDQT